jgi:hypothetical protein
VSGWAEARALLAAEDLRVAREGLVRLSLSPQRDRARALAEVAHELEASHPGAPAAIVRAWAEGLVALSRTIGESFPENLFFDVEAPAAALLEAGLRDGEPAVQERSELLVRLHGIFGGKTTIRFRYVHDFLYGFDWAKWVQRGVAERATEGPFSVAFLRAMHQRGHELLGLIERDDAKYPRLRDHRPRNPFGFSREPDDERRLFRDLAARGLLPVDAYRRGGPWQWNRPYAELREERARALGLERRCLNGG